MNGGNTSKKKKADVKLPEATEKLNDLLKKKSSQELVKELVNDKPTVDDFTLETQNMVFL